MDLEQHITAFMEAVAGGSIDIYNEFSLQHELGLYLRSRLEGCRVEFERNVSYFTKTKIGFEKKEIDIAISGGQTEPKQLFSAVELKYPRNGQVPESMFSFCKDISFLEQLVTAGFRSAYFVAVADDPAFYSGNSVGIYGLFRGNRPITGMIEKPTGAKDRQVRICGSYTANWRPIKGRSKFCVLPIRAEV